MTVTHRLHLLLLSAGKLLPSKYAPLGIKLLTVNDLNDFLLPASARSNSGAQYLIFNDVQIPMDTYALDKAITQSFDCSLLLDTA